MENSALQCLAMTSVYLNQNLNFYLLWYIEILKIRFLIVSVKNFFPTCGLALIRL